MNATIEELTKAIEIYGLLLHRTSILDDKLRDTQVSLWGDLIRARPGDGEVTSDDIREAIFTLVDADKMDPRTVMPPHVIGRAAQFAATRRERAKTLAGYDDTMLMYGERVRWMMARQLDDPDEADRELHRQIHAAIYDADHADLPTGTRTELKRRLRRQITQCGLDGLPVMPSLDA